MGLSGVHVCHVLSEVAGHFETFGGVLHHAKNRMYHLFLRMYRHGNDRTEKEG